MKSLILLTSISILAMTSASNAQYWGDSPYPAGRQGNWYTGTYHGFGQRYYPPSRGGYTGNFSGHYEHDYNRHYWGPQWQRDPYWNYQRYRQGW